MLFHPKSWSKCPLAVIFFIRTGTGLQFFGLKVFYGSLPWAPGSLVAWKVSESNSSLHYFELFTDPVKALEYLGFIPLDFTNLRLSSVQLVILYTASLFWAQAILPEPEPEPVPALYHWWWLSIIGSIKGSNLIWIPNHSKEKVLKDLFKNSFKRHLHANLTNFYNL